MIKEFNHVLGEHCESTSMRDVLEYIGLPLSEPMVFGLDATMGFSYFQGQTQGSMPIFVGGKQGTITENSLACRVLGVKIIEEQFQSADTAWERSKALLLKKIPLLIRIEMAYLPNIKLPEGEYFGGHILSIVGFDSEDAFLYERDMKDPVKLPIDVLKRGRSSKEDSWFPPKNAHYILEKRPKRPPLSAAVKLAIQQTVKNMLAASVNSLGLQGMKMFIQSIPCWKEIITGKKPAVTLELMYGYMEEFGTGGALFRNLFRDFLEEIISHPEITGGVRPWRTDEIDLVREQLELIRQSAQRWTRFAKELKKAVEKGKEDCVNNLDLKELEGLGWEILELEELVFNNLKAIKI